MRIARVKYLIKFLLYCTGVRFWLHVRTRRGKPCRNIPTPDESFVIIHFRKGAREKWGIDFQYLLGMIHDSFMSSPTSIVVNGGKMGFAMELILTPIIHKMIEEKKHS